MRNSFPGLTRQIRRVGHSISDAVPANPPRNPIRAILGAVHNRKQNKQTSFVLVAALTDVSLANPDGPLLLPASSVHGSPANEVQHDARFVHDGAVARLNFASDWLHDVRLHVAVHDHFPCLREVLSTLNLGVFVCVVWNLHG